jgi:sortase A
MPDTHAGQRAERGRRLRPSLDRLFTAAGLVLLGYAAVVTVDARLSQQRARAALALAASRAATPADASRALAPASGAPIGALSIPRVRLDAVVLHGSDARTLRRGPGHIEDTALPGQAGNVAIAGHRDTFFRPVRRVREGDDVFIDTADGRYRYRVVSLEVVDPHDTSVIHPTAAPTLTLITCYPFWVTGPAPDRFVVRAIEVSRPPGLPGRVPVQPR